MALDRTTAPKIRQIDHFSIAAPERRVMPNGIPLNVIQVGNEDVVRFDLLVRVVSGIRLSRCWQCLPIVCCVKVPKRLHRRR